MKRIGGFVSADDKRLLALAFIGVFGLGLAAHGYGFTNALFSHDSLDIFAHSTAHRVRLGRFMEPVYLFLRGDLNAPLLLGLCALVWLSLAAFLTAKLLRLRSAPTVLLVCGALATNAAFTLTSATYGSWLDVFMMANLLAVLSVWIYEKYRYGFLWGAIPLVISLGLYQSYLQVTVILLLILLAERLLDGAKARDVFLAGLKAVAMLLIGLALYAGVLRALLTVMGLEALDTFNGVAGVGDLAGENIPRLLLYTAAYTAYTFLNPASNAKALVICANLALIVGACVRVFWLARNTAKSGGSTALLAFLMLLMPFGVDCVYFIAKGNVHSLSKFAMYYLYIFALALHQRSDAVRLSLGARCGALRRWLAPALLAIVLWDNVVYANQLYLKKDLELQSTNLLMTRVIDRMEQTEGYVPGETEAVFVGTPENSALLPEHMGFDHFQGIGTEPSSAITYYGTLDNYLKQVLGYPVNLLGEERAAEFAALPEVRAMPVFPARGSCDTVNGVLVVKMAEPSAKDGSGEPDTAAKALSEGVFGAIRAAVGKLFR